MNNNNSFENYTKMHFWDKTNSINEFSFKTHKLSSGIWFLTLNLIIPFILLLILYLIYKPDNKYLNVYLLISFSCQIISFIYLLIIDSKLFINSGLFIYFIFQTAIKIFMLFANTILANLTISMSVIFLIRIWLIIILELIIIFLTLTFTQNLKKKIISTFKADSLKILSISFLVSMFAIFINLIFTYFLRQNSENQNSLIQDIGKETNVVLKVLMIITLGIFTIIVAPLTEEIVFRQLWFVGISQRMLACISSAIMFGLIHIDSVGDFENIGVYVVIGFILSTLFNLAEGNIVYSWITHMFINSVAFGFSIVSL